ncbi:MAG: hypothetical protein ABJE66_26850 [Deltaproteobacteria bacterium]
MTRTRASWLDLMKRADHAIALDDLAAFARVATLLSTRVGDPLGPSLLALVRACRFDTELAGRHWPALRDQVAARVAVAGT